MQGAVKRLVVALTGGIGSGKTAAAEMFAQHGAAVVDVDQVAHELTAPGGMAMPAIEAAFGSDVIAADGSLDRAAMRRMVFADASARARLEVILHPMIRSASDARVEAALVAGAPYVILGIPLLVESRRVHDRSDRVLVVDCPEALQVARVTARSGITADEVAAIMAAQASRAERLAVADDVIVNDGDLARLQEQVAVLHVKYCSIVDKIRAGG